MRYLFPLPATRLIRRVGQLTDWSVAPRLLILIMPATVVISVVAAWIGFSSSSHTLKEAISSIPLVEAKVQAHSMTAQLARLQKALHTVAQSRSLSRNATAEILKGFFHQDLELIYEIGVFSKSPDSFVIFRDAENFREVPLSVIAQDPYSSLHQVTERPIAPGHSVIFPVVQTDVPRGDVSGEPRPGQSSHRTTVMRLAFHDEATDAIYFIGIGIQKKAESLGAMLKTGAPLASPKEANVQQLSFFFDLGGWIIFEMSNNLGLRDYLPDHTRRGFMGDLGRPGMDAVFRPAAEYTLYWSMVMAVTQGKADKVEGFKSAEMLSYASDSPSLCYAPVLFSAIPGGEPQPIGGIAFFETSSLPTTAFFKIANYTVGIAFGVIALFGLYVWLVGRNIGRPLVKMANDIRNMLRSSEFHSVEISQYCEEHHRVQTAVNSVLAKATTLAAELELVRNEMKRSRSVQPIEIGQDFVLPTFEEKYGLVGSTNYIRDLRNQVDKAARAGTDVLVFGETGTGKEIVANAIHRASVRADGPFISINCGALDENLLLDALFGHVKGAFSEAKNDRKGAFLAADKGTLFLDEIATASPKVQQALLRTLSIRRVTPLGSDADLPVNVRVVAASNADLLELSRQNAFREDLYYRLAIITIKTPPLRQHMQDIPELAAFFIQEAAAQLKRTPARLTRGALDVLNAHSWPGNIRELRNCIMRTMAFTDGDLILERHIAVDHSAYFSLDNMRKPEQAQEKKEIEKSTEPSEKIGWDTLPADFIWRGASRAKRTVPETPATPASSATGITGGPSCPYPPVGAGSGEGTSQDRAEAGADAYFAGHGARNGTPDAALQGGSKDVFAAEAENPRSFGPQHPGTLFGNGGYAVPEQLRADSVEETPEHPLLESNLPGDLNIRQRKALGMINQQGGITRAQYQQIAGRSVSQRTVQNDLRQLVEWGILEKKGAGPATYYMLKKSGGN